jgi:hypothetical protein
MLCRASAVLGWGLLELGRLPEADDAISRGLELAESSQSSALRAAAYATTAALRERQGKSEEAKRNRTEARALVPSIDASADKGWRVWR